MSVLKRHTVPGMTKEDYEKVSDGVADSQRAAPGFVAHYAVFDDDALTVTEVWDSQAEHDTWFGENVRPHLPEGAPAPEFAEIHRARTPTD